MSTSFDVHVQEAKVTNYGTFGSSNKLKRRPLEGKDKSVIMLRLDLYMILLAYWADCVAWLAASKGSSICVAK